MIPVGAGHARDTHVGFEESRAWPAPTGANVGARHARDSRGGFGESRAWPAPTGRHVGARHARDSSGQNRGCRNDSQPQGSFAPIRKAPTVETARPPTGKTA